MALVFQYGSNCSEAQINGDDRLRGDAEFVGIAETVDAYQLAFDVWSQNRGCAASNIIPTPGSTVWGVLYEIPDWLMSRDSARGRNRKSLDAIEGEGTNYRRTTIRVRKSDGQVVIATTYVVMNPRAGLRTNIDYVRHVISGLRERSIAREYIESVKAIAERNNPDLTEDLKGL